MAKRTKTYIPAPTRDSPPDGPILLGNIIASQYVPEECLNLEIPNPVMKDIRPLEAHKIGWQDCTENQRDDSCGVYAQILQIMGVGGDVGGGRKGSNYDELFVERMDTYWFNPSEGNINRSIEDPCVRAYMAKNGYHQPVFLITGIMIARGASVLQNSMKRCFFHTQIGADLTAVGAPVTIGPKGSFSRRVKREIAYEKSSDFVLAYRLTKIKVTRKDKISYTKHTQGALYSRSKLEQQPEEQEDESSYTTTVNFEDVGASDLNSDGIEIIDGENDFLEMVSLPT